MLPLIRWLSRRGLPTLHALGTVLGWLAWWASPTYRGHLRTLLAQAGQGDAVRRAHCPGRPHGAELPWLWLRPADRPLGTLVQWQGAELMDAASTPAAAWCC
jgi:Kdo2-lipid IVA lauroyltransferase/acyltransferase